LSCTSWPLTSYPNIAARNCSRICLRVPPPCFTCWVHVYSARQCTMYSGWNLVWFRLGLGLSRGIWLPQFCSVYFFWPIFLACFFRNTLPSRQRATMNGTILQLHKSGGTNKTSDQRPVVLLNSVYQLLHYVINERLGKIVEPANILEPGQGGGR